MVSGKHTGMMEWLSNVTSFFNSNKAMSFSGGRPKMKIHDYSNTLIFVFLVNQRFMLDLKNVSQ